MYRKKLFKLPLTIKVAGEEEHVRYIRCTYTFLKKSVFTYGNFKDFVNHGFELRNFLDSLKMAV